MVKRKFPVNMSFVDKPGNAVHPSREDYSTRKSKKVGKAYAFFYYQGRTRHILEELPNIRDKYETPSELSLNLVEGVNNLNTAKDSALVEIVEQAKRQRMSHILEATLPDAGNKKTADLLGDITTGVNYSLYDKQEPFYAGIVYKKGEQYVFRRE